MPADFRIELTPDAKTILAQIETFPRRMQIGIVRAMNAQNELTASTAIEKRLNVSADIPGRIEWLRRRTGRLQKSIRRGQEGNISEAARVEGDTVYSSIGTNVRYAAIHEFGWSGVVAPHIRRRFKKVSLLGEFAPLRRTLGGIVGATKHKTIRRNVRGADIFVRQSKPKTIPARPFLSTTIKEREPQYSEAISKAVVDSWNEGNPT
jgi:phage gpG-like protein